MESLADQSIHPDRYEVVLIDDGSTDGTGEMAKSLDLPYRLTYGYQEHSALATARNHGIRLSRGEIMLYIDDDVLADHHLLEEHLRAPDMHKNCVVNGWVNHVEEAVIPKKPKFTMADISTSFFWTSNVGVRVDDLYRAGLFDESFKEYGWEDQEIWTAPDGHRLGPQDKLQSRGLSHQETSYRSQCRRGPQIGRSQSPNRSSLHQAPSQATHPFLH